jgi:hypothetical protein
MDSEVEKDIFASIKNAKRNIFVFFFIVCVFAFLAADYLIMFFPQINAKFIAAVGILAFFILLLTILGFIFCTKLMELLDKVFTEIKSSTLIDFQQLGKISFFSLISYFDFLGNFIAENIKKLEIYSEQVENCNARIRSLSGQVGEKVELEILNVLHNLNKIILRSYNAGKISDLVVQEVCNYMQVKSAFAIIWGKDETVAKVSSYHMEKKAIEVGKKTIKPDIFGSEGEKTIIIGSRDYVNPYIGFEKMGMKNGTVAPIKSRERIIGALVMGDKLSGESYTEKDCQLMTLFCDVIAIAIHNAKLYKGLKAKG